jgi:hypothetical protein
LKTKKILLLAPAPVIFPTNEVVSQSVFDAEIGNATANCLPDFMEICSMSSDKQEASESSSAVGSDANEGTSQQNNLEEAERGFPIPGVSLVLSAFPHPGFPGGSNHRTGRFVIRLTFPGGELPDQDLEVTTNMTVSALQRCLAEMMGRVVSMFVAPSWDQLNHNGLIVARYLPGTATPCPGLVPGSLLRVYAWEPFHDEATQSSGTAKRSREDNDESARSASSSSGPLLWKPRQDRPPAHVSDDEESSSSNDDESPPPGCGIEESLPSGKSSSSESFQTRDEVCSSRFPAEPSIKFRRGDSSRTRREGGSFRPLRRGQ